MKQRSFAGRQVGAIGLGCMSFGGAVGPTDQVTSLRCLAAAIDQGIDFLDTANVYGMGRSEEVIGEYLRRSGGRDRLCIATKAGIVNAPPRHFDNSPAHLRAELEASLRRLGVDHIDLFYIHRREKARPVEEVAVTLSQLVAEGKIGGYGLSEVSPATLRRAHAVHPCLAVQSEYSLWTRQPELGMIQACAALGITFVPFSPLGRGVFGQEFPVMANLQEADFRHNLPRFQEPAYAANRAAIAGFRTFAAERGWSCAAAAIAWLLDQAPHLIPIPGTRSAAHLGEWAGADQITFTQDDRAAIARLLPTGFAEGDRYAEVQTLEVERYC